MKRVISAVAALLFVCAWSVGLGVDAHAAGQDAITRFEVDATVDQSGTITVTQTIDDYFASSGHGPQLYLITRQQYDSSHDRRITYDNIRVTSPTGAPTSVDISQENKYMTLRIGDKNVTVRGTQTYVLTYTVTGLINTDQAQSHLDEVYWNVIGTGWELPISNISVTIHGPTAVSQTVCYTGADFKTPCTSNSSSGSTATYTQDTVRPGSGLAVGGGWPAGTFSGAKLDLVSSSQNPFGLSDGGAVPAGIAGLATVLGGWFLTRLRKKGRDEQFANVTPGMMPVGGDKAEIKHEEVKDAAVEFTPPPGIPPRLVGAVVREGTANQDITATIIDLAVRGYLRMEQQEGDQFVLTKTTADPGSLNPVDRSVYNGLFAGRRSSVSSEQMADQDFYETYTGFQETLTDEFAAQHWYKINPGAVVTAYTVGGLVIAGGGAVLSIFIGTRLAANGILGVGWLAVPFLLVGLGMAALAKRMPVRTPTGSAVAVKAIGFKKYLETAEADQIRWEEGQDIFSRYLPYAISFGCAERWAKVFEELAARGMPMPEPSWYVGSYMYNAWMWSSIIHSVDNIGQSFADSVSANAAAQAAATGGSSGGSAFSGGGFGGGIGGGGGGNW
ncbi:MAG: DUF2207 domain-containing protein [Propionibacteriaceae bacterium]|nr:DUF2207 domain-containing protein [Propionibacteriaceae bacterium]